MSEPFPDVESVARRKADGHFTLIANSALRDDRLSYRAKGVLVSALSHSKSFRLTRQWLNSHGTEGRDAITKAIQELRDLGYVFDEWVTENGRPTRRMTWTDHPEGGQSGPDPSVDARGTENPSDGKPVALKTRRTGNQSHIKKINPQEDQELQEDQSVGRAAPDGAATDRGKRSKVFRPRPEDVPPELGGAAAELLTFWGEKAGSKSHRAWLVLLAELRKIQTHREGGIAVVREQLQNGTQAGWASCTFSNWERYGRQRVQGITPRGCRADEKSIAELAAEMEAMPVLSFNQQRR